MKIVIVGDGKVGSTLAEQLSREGHDITIVDHSPDPLQQTTEALDILCIEGNGATYETQIEAGVDSADLLIAVTASDELNLLCCLIAKKAGAQHTIARVRNPEYDSQLSLITDEPVRQSGADLRDRDRAEPAAAVGHAGRRLCGRTCGAVAADFVGAVAAGGQDADGAAGTDAVERADRRR